MNFFMNILYDQYEKMRVISGRIETVTDAEGGQIGASHAISVEWCTLKVSYTDLAFRGLLF